MEMSPDVTLHIGSFVAGEGVQALARTNHDIERRVALIVPQAQVVIDAESVSSLAQLRGVLGTDGAPSIHADAAPGESPPVTVRQLPRALRSTPLAVLARRVPVLPQREAWEARTELVGAAGELSPADLGRHVASLLGTVRPGEARGAAANGVNIAQIAQAHQITDPAVIRSLEMQACTSPHPDSAGGRARAGGHVPTVAAECGITSPEGIRELENQQINSIDVNSAGYAANAGHDLAQVAERHGISTPEGRVRLQHVAIRANALMQVNLGNSVQSVVEVLGINSPELIQELNALEALLQPDPPQPAVDERGRRRRDMPFSRTPPGSPAPEATHAGSAANSASQAGTDAAGGIAELALDSITAEALSSVQGGESVRSVVERLGGISAQLRDQLTAIEAALQSRTRPPGEYSRRRRS